jgi:hypothetical protein
LKNKGLLASVDTIRAVSTLQRLNNRKTPRCAGEPIHPAFREKKDRFNLSGSQKQLESIEGSNTKQRMLLRGYQLGTLPFRTAQKDATSLPNDWRALNRFAWERKYLLERYDSSPE